MTHDDEARGLLEILANEVETLRAKYKRTSGELAKSDRRSDELDRREDEVWEPLLAAANRLAEDCPREQSLDAWHELDIAIAACEEKP